ncbi:MAG: RluA family pseudouridine synthase [Lachnospiraceae bacterium]|nr:RluA family pseudouridine synthase [Lachnospiraceae bacterium]
MTDTESFRFTVTEEQEEIRLDRLLSELMPEQSRSYLQKLIKDQAVTVNGAPAKPSAQTLSGDVICVEMPASRFPAILPQDIPIDIIYEDSDVIVVNKSRGMVVHPAPGHYDGTLVNALMYHCHDLSGINGVLRPGIVHRIDRDTSGLLVVCKNDRAHEAISLQLKDHSVKRSYQALAYGSFKEKEGTVDAPIGRDTADRKKMCVHKDLLHAKRAVTHYTLLEELKECSHIECRLETGRTHQIRVHMAHIGHALLGDPLYAGKKAFEMASGGQILHAKTLGFIHPSSGEEILFDSDLPEYFIKTIQKYRK